MKAEKGLAIEVAKDRFGCQSNSLVLGKVLFSLESPLEYGGSNRDYPLKGRTIEKLEICLSGVVSDPLDVFGSRVTNSEDHSASSRREGSRCSESRSIDRWHRRRCD
jgi:hypothetical protein